MASNRRPWTSESVSTVVLANMLLCVFKTTESHPMYNFNLVTRSLICIVSTLSKMLHKNTKEKCLEDFI